MEEKSLCVTEQLLMCICAEPYQLCSFAVV